MKCKNKFLSCRISRLTLMKVESPGMRLVGSFCYHQKFHCREYIKLHNPRLLTFLWQNCFYFSSFFAEEFGDPSEMKEQWGWLWVGGGGGGERRGGKDKLSLLSNHCFLFFNWTIAPLTWTSFRSSRLRNLSNIAFSLDKVSFNFLKKRGNKDKSFIISHLLTRLYEDSHSVFCSCSCSAESSMVWRESSGKDDSLSCLLIVAMIKTVSVTMVTRTCKPTP